MPPLRSTGPFPEAEHPEYAGEYRLEAVLGTGGMGIVHLATSASGLRLAVKVIHAEHASDAEFRARFRQEVAAARRVSGAFTAPVVDADPEAERPWMATLFIDGPTLAERVKRNGPLGTQELRRAGAGLAEALRDIHRAGVVHRDLKPSNVLLAPDGPKVIDFGISRPSDSDLRTETGKLIGTPPFMAPEQFQRPREVGPAADVFALGAVLVHAATGRGPFGSDSPYIVAYQVVHNEPDLAGVPADLEPLLRRCLAKDPADRPTPDEVMVALRASSPSTSYDTQAYIPVPRMPDPRESVAGAEPADPAPGRSEPPEVREQAKPAESGKPRRRRLRWAAAGAVLAVLVTAGIVVLRADPGDHPPGNGPAGRLTVQKVRPWSVALRGSDHENRTPFCTAGGPALFCTAPGIKAVRLHPADGRTLWSEPAEPAARPAQGTPPVYDDGLLYVTSGGGRLEALDTESGKVLWDLDVSAYATVRHAGDVILLVKDSGLVRAVDAGTGKERWSRRPGGPGAQWFSAPGDAKGPVVAVTLSRDGTSTLVRAVDPVGGGEQWQKRLPGVLTPVGLTDGTLTLLVSDKNGFTNAVVRLETGGREPAVRRIPLSAPVDQAQATVAGDIVHISGFGGSLLALDTTRTKNAQLWRLETGVTYLSPPTAGGGSVFVSAGDGRLLAVDARGGSLVGQTEPRMDDGRHTFASTLAAPVVTAAWVYATAPDGSVFAVRAAAPARW
ncbi:PQQ-binding-like beta-propeller repeat protein [Streptomyces sp. NPDC006208]|uniref:serine/threonine-protein kinase n=1 Tax=Streptomyces sp. NPDC006208 TaxID=3156734 RepID=UPI0033BD2EB8